MFDIMKMKGKLAFIFKNHREESFLLLFILVVTTIAPFFSPVFFTSFNLLNLMRQISYTAIASVGMLLTVLIGGIDLSVGAVMQIVGLASILLIQSHLPVWLVIILVLLFGAVLGLVNGTLITFGRLQPFIVTLGTKVIIDGCTLVISKGKGIGGNISSQFLAIGAGYIGPVPVPVVIMIIVFIIGFLILNKTVFGRSIYAVGSNRLAAFNSGINVKKIQLLVYSLSGFLAAISGLLIASRTGAFQPITTHGGAAGMELNAIAAVVVGGASLAGGKGTIIGAFLGALVSGLLFNLLVLLNINPYVQQFILGVIILLAVIFSASENRKST